MPRASKQQRHMKAMRATFETKKAGNTLSSGIANSIDVEAGLKVALEDFLWKNKRTPLLKKRLLVQER
ncbi:unnamed protein product [Albugo candida]|uniref:Uncharacterized protein n=1 Tax=Albugo candida TaxID=65357 RepID=A0A024FX70_9STRA|nr:unnamed protein product [Albugo candida]|eukprot:CCI11783.1 unnamed protein product [Albugo candida]